MATKTGLSPDPTHAEEARAERVHPDVNYEISDINVWGVIAVGTGVLVTMLLIVGLLHFLFVHFAYQSARQSPPPLPIAAQGRPLPPEPRLQQSPHEDLERLRTTEDWQLQNYSWIDRSKGVVGIPIEQAIDLTAQHGIPVEKNNPSQYFEPHGGDRLTGFEGREQPAP